MNDRYDTLLAAGLRKITPESGEPVYLVVIDEYAYFSATVGDRKQQAEFSALTRDLVARGRAAGVIVILLSQAVLPVAVHSPVPAGTVRLPVGLPAHHPHRSSPADGAGPRLARRGLHRRQHQAPRPGRLLLRPPETGTPRRIKAAYLSDDDIRHPRPPRCETARAGGRIASSVAAATIPLSPRPPDPGPGLAETAHDRLPQIRRDNLCRLGGPAAHGTGRAGQPAATSAGGNASSTEYRSLPEAGLLAVRKDPGR